MNLGYGYLVKIPTEEVEKHFLFLLSMKKDNYIIVSKKPQLIPTHPIEYFVTAKDGVLFEVSSYPDMWQVPMSGLIISSCTEVPLWVY